MATTTEGKGAARMHAPSHPGELLKQLYMDTTGITVTQAAEALGVSRKHLSEIVNGRTNVTPDMAARLAVVFNTDAALWINLQAQYDIWIVNHQPLPKLKQLREAS